MYKNLEDVSNFTYRSVKILLLELGSELPNLVKKFTEFPRSGMHRGF